MYTASYVFAQVKVTVHSYSERLLSGRYEAFRDDSGTSADYECIIRPLAELNADKDTWKLLYDNKSSSCYQCEHGCCRVVRTEDYPETYIFFDPDEPKKIMAYMLDRNERMMTNPLDLMCFDIPLIHRHGFMLHSSFVEYGGRAVLFTAPSGTGKSTQAELCRKYLGADVINGDRTLLRRENGGWNAYGSPWAGSSDIIVNRKVPDPVIFIIRQSHENKIFELSKAEAFSLILSETHAPLVNDKIADMLFSLIEALVTECGVYMFECRPDREASKTVKSILLNM